MPGIFGPILFNALGGPDMVKRNLPPGMQGIAGLMFNPVHALFGVQPAPNQFGEQFRRGIAEYLPQRMGDFIAPERVSSPEQEWIAPYDPGRLEGAIPFPDVDFMGNTSDVERYGLGLMTDPYGGSVQDFARPRETYDPMGERIESFREPMPTGGSDDEFIMRAYASGGMVRYS